MSEESEILKNLEYSIQGQLTGCDTACLSPRQYELLLKLIQDKLKATQIKHLEEAWKNAYYGDWIKKHIESSPTSPSIEKERPNYAKMKNELEVLKKYNVHSSERDILEATIDIFEKLGLDKLQCKWCSDKIYTISKGINSSLYLIAPYLKLEVKGELDLIVYINSCPNCGRIF